MLSSVAFNKPLHQCISISFQFPLSVSINHKLSLCWGDCFLLWGFLTGLSRKFLSGHTGRTQVIIYMCKVFMVHFGKIDCWIYLWVLKQHYLQIDTEFKTDFDTYDHSRINSNSSLKFYFTLLGETWSRGFFLQTAGSYFFCHTLHLAVSSLVFNSTSHLKFTT